ncbi:FxsA family protein [Candidatus Blastococcus massiliensis]|uniref:FxsA family protein n=1 Tax=Candidatus Blastococcus massiliensis TaxID=1470358 RepID=UPI0004B6EDD8|nr:FxsA family protein [Candidatus Blastococcus massiliensis]
MGRRIRIAAGLFALAEIVVFVLVAQWVGAGVTVLAALATTVLGWALLARQGTKALLELRESARTRRAAGRELGNAGLVAVGGLLMVLPGFIGDLLGLLCLLPGTRSLVRAGLTALIASRLPGGLRPPVRVDSVRTAEMPQRDDVGTTPLVIEGEVLRGPDGRPLS